MPKNRTDEPEEAAVNEAASIIHNRVIMVNPHSKGNLGKTTFYEFCNA